MGRRGLALVKRVFAAWHAFREERLTRERLEAATVGLAGRLNKLLTEGWINGVDQPVRTFCGNLLEVEDALWTFTRVAGVEPTNNFMERLLRRAVLWRRRSVGCASEAGCRFVERILTVVQTRRLQGRGVLDYLLDAVRTHRLGLPCPTLLDEG